MRASGYSDASVYCVHSVMHPRNKKWQACVPKRSYHDALHAARDRCAHARHKEPVWAAHAIAEFITVRRHHGVPERVLCCVHDRMKRHLAKPKAVASQNIWRHLRVEFSYCVQL